MSRKDFIITKLEGYSGIRLLDNQPLCFSPGINLLVGRNGSGKTNLLRLIQSIFQETSGTENYLETSYLQSLRREILKQCEDYRDEYIIDQDILGEIQIISYSYHNKRNSIYLGIKPNRTKYSISKELEREKTTDYTFYVKHNRSFDADWYGLFNSRSTQKLNIDASPYYRMFSTDPNEESSSILQEPVNMVNQFIERKYREYFESDEFRSQVKKLEEEINKRYSKFLGQTAKRISIDFDPTSLDRHVMKLIDKGNVVDPEMISDGEKVLLNLLTSFGIAEQECYDMLSIDEPDLYMHDDMIKILAQELISISESCPETIIMVASHSAALIENLAKSNYENLNLIVFDEDRRVRKSNEEIDFVNALNRNGVWFSPLMLSKRPNLFIENQGESGMEFRDLFLKFFDRRKPPNVIPIGSSGNVEQKDSFADIFRDLVELDDIKSYGIQDGDQWMKEYLINYLDEEIDLDKLMSLLRSENGMYLQHSEIKPSAYYFNCWEIENLWLMDETIESYIKDDQRLIPKQFVEFLRARIDFLSNEYLEFYYKRGLYARYYKTHDLSKKVEKLEQKLNKARDVLAQKEKFKKRSIDLVTALINSDLIRWLPGKEIAKELRKEGYEFDDSGLDYENLELSKRIRQILDM